LVEQIVGAFHRLIERYGRLFATRGRDNEAVAKG
jgi:hypothetical protein